MNSYQKIIDELKENGKYDDWISHGSYFGQTSSTIKAKFFLSRPYQYYDMNNYIVHVSAISKTFRADVNNMPVFKQNVIKDLTNVNQSTFRFVDVTDRLSTAGLATCTGLAMIIGTKKFLTHLDANTQIYPIIHALRQVLGKELLDATSIKNVNIYAGDLDSTLTVQKAKEICSKIGIESNITVSNVSMFDRVSI